MNSLHILTIDESYYAIQFPTIFEYSNSHANVKQLNEYGQYYSKNKLFVNNGDTFNGKYIIEYFQKNASFDVNDYTTIPDIILNEFNGLDTTKLYKILNNTQDYAILIENINIISSIGLLTKKQYNNFLDKPSNTKKLSFLSKNYNKCSMFFKPHLIPLQQPKLKHKTNKDYLNLKIITTLFNKQSNRTRNNLKNCTIIKNNAISTKLMQCSSTIFDITNGSESELQQAKIAFNYIYNELIKYSDEEIKRCKENGIIRKFILISTLMTWVTDTNSYPIYSENEETHIGIIQENILERLPIPKYQIIFEFEKLILKSNSSKIKDIFKTYIISTGIIYGHEENALHNVFINAWNYPKEMYVLMLNRTVPVFHIDELAKLVLIISKYDHYVKGNYILAVEQESYGFNNIIKSVCDELRSSCLVLKEDNFIKKQYQFTSFTWDLICSNLKINPKFDIIVPNYQMDRKPIIPNIKKLAQEFIKATNLISLKLIIYGQNKHVTSNIAEHLAQYYQVQLINISNLIKSYLTSIENIKNELMLKINIFYKQRTDIIQSLSKLSNPSKNEWFDCDDKFTKEMHFSDEEIIMMDDRKHKFEILYEKSNMSDNDLFSELSESETSLNIINIKDDSYIQNGVYKLHMQNKNKKDLLDIDKAINNLKNQIDDLNNKYKKYENYKQSKHKKSLDLDSHLLLKIKESLASSSCHNQGYIFDFFSLSVDQMKYLFNDEFFFPNIMVLLTNKNNSIFCEREMINNSIIKNEISKRYNLNHNTKIEFNNLKYRKLNNYKRDVDYNKTNIRTDIYDNRRSQDSFKNEEHIYINNNYKYEISSINDNCIGYFTNKGINILKLTVPLELSDDTRSYNNLQYQVFTDTIITRIGDSYSHKKSYIYPYDTIINTFYRQITLTNKIDKLFTNEKNTIVLNKLTTMKQQWDNEIVKAQEWKKNKEYGKSLKIHNFLKTSILPKLLKEISLDKNIKIL